jgi:amino acid transporter
MGDTLNAGGKQTLKRDIGLLSAIAIVVGSMIGSGIFMAPQGLAEYANPTAGLIAMALTGIGSLLLALCFVKMSTMEGELVSPIMATQRAFGELPAFFSGWAYWCGCWVANGTIILGGLNYLSYFFPSLQGNSFAKYILSIAIIWFYTLLNIKGVKESSRFNLVMTVAKLAPIVMILVVAPLRFNAANFTSVSSEDVAGMGVIPIAMTYTLWSFLGFEGIVVNAAEVKNINMVKKGTVIGTCIVIVIYLLLTVFAAGNLPQSHLVASESPFADILQNSTGVYWAGGFIALAVALSAFGCIGAWIISAASAAYSLGEQGLMPQKLATVHPKLRTPVTALLVNGVLMTFIMLLAFFNQEGSVYNFFLLLSTLALLVFYVLGAASEIALSGKGIKKFNVWNFIKCSFVGLVAFAYAVFTVYGSGAEYVMYGFILLLVGIPVYTYVKLKRYHDAKKQQAGDI